MTSPEAAVLLCAMRAQLIELREDQHGGNAYACGSVSALLKAASDSLMSAAFTIDRDAASIATKREP